MPYLNGTFCRSLPNFKFANLTPLAQRILQHMEKAGSISALDAMATYGVSSASLARRICDLEEQGVKIGRTRKEHPITGRKYTRYQLGTA